MTSLARFTAASLVVAASLAVSPLRAQVAAYESPEAAQALAGPSDYAQIGRACRSRRPVDAGYPPSVATPVTVRAIQPIIPVPATDGLIHIAFAAEVINVPGSPSSIDSLTPVDPLAKGVPTGTNSVLDASGNDVTGKVFLLATNAFKQHCRLVQPVTVVRLAQVERSRAGLRA